VGISIDQIRFRGLLAGALVLTALSSSAAQFANQHHEPFQTVQPGVGVISLQYEGDEHVNWYVDPQGYTVLHKAGRYYFADLDESGALTRTEHLVGAVDPATVGLTPMILPSADKLAALREQAALQMPSFAPPTDPGIPEGTTLVEGCIVVPDSPMHDGSGDPQHGTSITSGFWPDGIVPYTFDSSVSSSNQTKMRDAMDSWEAVANVQFVERTTESAYIEVISGSGNWSYVGRIGGKQQLSVYNWSYHFIIMHELAHALGVWHEQSRPDRDDYVTIETDNITSGFVHNFDKHSSAGTNGSYDFDSIMHYGQCAFSSCACSSSCRTITVDSPNEAWQNQIGQRNHLSTGDAANMAALYGDPMPDGVAELTAPAMDGDSIPEDSYTFEWTTGTNVTQYALEIGTFDGGSDVEDYTGTDTSLLVEDLPTENGDLYVRLKSQISGEWYTQSYVFVFGEDICPGHPDNVDADNDGVPDGCDVCPGADDDLDTDGDGTPDCLDECPDDENKIEEGDCGCGKEEVDSDADGVSDCADECPNTPTKVTEGACGCDVEEVDSDFDGTPDCNDDCPFDSLKTTPGLCGCGVRTVDLNRDGVFECDNGDQPLGGTERGTDNGNDGLTNITNVTTTCGSGGAASAVSLMMLAGMVRGRRKRQRI